MNSEFRSWSDLRVFLAVMEHGSTLRAAGPLGMSQPTVARRIDALEHELGLTLFERDTRGFQPTESALAIQAEARRVESAIAAFVDAAVQQRPERPIRITAFSANLSRRFSDIIGSYSLKHPESTFEFLTSARVLDLMAGEADIALRLTRTPPDDRLICRKISTAQFAPYVSQSYADRFGIPASPEELMNHRVLAYERSDMAIHTLSWLLKHVPRNAVTKFYSELELYDAAIRAGQGVGVINVRMAEDYERVGDLIRCFGPIDELAMEHLMLVTPMAYRRPEVRRFTKYFAPRYAKYFK